MKIYKMRVVKRYNDLELGRKIEAGEILWDIKEDRAKKLEQSGYAVRLSEIIEDNEPKISKSQAKRLKALKGKKNETN